MLKEKRPVAPRQEDPALLEMNSVNKLFKDFSRRISFLAAASVPPGGFCKRLQKCLQKCFFKYHNVYKNVYKNTPDSVYISVYKNCLLKGFMFTKMITFTKGVRGVSP